MIIKLNPTNNNMNITILYEPNQTQGNLGL